MYPLLIVGDGVLLCAVVPLSLDSRLVVQPPSGICLSPWQRVSALRDAVWHYQMLWLEATQNTPVHNPMVRAVAGPYPVQDRGPPCAQKSESWECLVSSTYGHCSILSSSRPKWPSSRSCFMPAILNASLNVHIRQY